MALNDTLDSLVGDIDAQIAALKVKFDTDMTALKNRKAVLRQAQLVLTPQIEAAFLALKSAGVL